MSENNGTTGGELIRPTRRKLARNAVGVRGEIAPPAGKDITPRPAPGPLVAAAPVGPAGELVRLRTTWYGDEAWRRGYNGPIDAETVDDAEFAATGERIRETLEGQFASPHQRAARTAYDVRIEQDLARSAGDGGDGQSPLLTLRSELHLAESSYMGWVTRTNLLGKKDAKKKIDSMHTIYMQRTMQAMVKPLSQGVNAASVVQVAGTMAAMALLSPDVRAELGKQFDGVKDAIQQRMHVERKRQVEHYGKLTQKGKTGSDRDRRRYAMWEERLARSERTERGDRNLLTVRTAALTEVGLMRNCFTKLRQPGADREAVMKDYKTLLGTLRDHAAKDQLDHDEVTSEIRRIVGDHMEHDPSMRISFEGLSHGRMVKSHLREVRMAGSQKTRMVWDGDFETQLGKTLLKDGGRFVVREPMSAEQHQAQITDTMVRTLGDALRRGDRTRFGAAASGYMVGYATAGSHIDPPEDIPEVLRDRIRDAETMVGAMAIDGHGIDEIRQTYSMAYADAMEELSNGGYDLNEEFTKTFGTNWEQRLTTAGADPVRFFAEEQLNQRARAAAEEWASRPGYYAGSEGPAADREEYMTAEQDPQNDRTAQHETPQPA